VTTPRGELGMVGLGVMGRNLLLNFASHGHAVCGHDRDPAHNDALLAAAAGLPVTAAADLPSLVAQLAPPRAVMLLVPAGAPVDDVLDHLLPLLARDDVVVDGGNSHFRDTERRAVRCGALGIPYLGLGISGGEAGARHGPSLMPGGDFAAWQRVRPLLEAAAARVAGEPCVAYLGPGACGHHVKMVHNGIEYGLMQLIAEAYDILRHGLGLDLPAVQATFARWNDGELRSYLLEITARILEHQDPRTGQPLIDVIADAAGQKGTGMWTSREAQDLQVPIPAIDIAVTMRDLSGDAIVRGLFADRFPRHRRPVAEPPSQVVASLAGALRAATILTYAQGLALLQRAATAHGFGLDLATVARIWRGGCIIRADVLADVQAAFAAAPQLPHLLGDDTVGHHVLTHEPQLRETVVTAIAAGLPVPGLAACLGYLDAYRADRLPTNLIQAQRDFFGAHTYRRRDDDVAHHTAWESTP
jgi:6-phosphogluconate dehydrogenase